MMDLKNVSPVISQMVVAVIVCFPFSFEINITDQEDDLEELRRKRLEKMKSNHAVLSSVGLGPLGMAGGHLLGTCTKRNLSCHPRCLAVQVWSEKGQNFWKYGECSLVLTMGGFFQNQSACLSIRITRFVFRSRRPDGVGDAGDVAGRSSCVAAGNRMYPLPAKAPSASSVM